MTDIPRSECAAWRRYAASAVDSRAWLICFSSERGTTGRAPSLRNEEPHFRVVIGSSDCEKGGYVDAKFNTSANERLRTDSLPAKAPDSPEKSAAVP